MAAPRPSQAGLTHAPACAAVHAVGLHGQSDRTVDDPSSGSGTRSLPRVLVLDLLRLIAAVQMVQGHTIDAVLAPDYRHGALYQGWLWLRGLTSVAFLSVAGMSFHLATFRGRDERTYDPAASAARLRRAGSLVALGYLLRLPLPMAAHDDLASLLRLSAATDVLQCIGVSLAFLEVLVLVMPKRRAVEAVCGLLAIVVLGLSPQLARLDPSGPWLPLLDYLTPRAGSPFPLLPWSAHLLLGVALSPWLFGARWRLLRLLFTGGLLLALATLLRSVAPPLIADHLRRFGLVVVGLGLLSPLELWLRAGFAKPLQLSRETLFIYALHVLLVYGRGVGLAALIGRRLAPGAAVATALCVLGVSFACAFGYRRVLAGLARSAATG